MRRERNERKEGYAIKTVAALLTLAILFSFSLLAVSSANAEAVTIQKALTWRADDPSALALPKVSQKVYSPADFVATAGQINSVTVNWEADGAIYFEVSLDNGLHYYPVVNGVPLKNDFVNGDRLRWRATTYNDETKLTSVRISYTDTSGVMGDFGEPSLSGFSYRKQLFIKNTSTQDLYNYQIKIKIGESESVKDVDVNCSAHTLADFNDIRFTAADSQTPLAYYLENLEGTTPDRTATFWVKVPQIPKAGVAIYLYYGNSDAKSLSDAAATFDFYEDFKAASLDKNKWLVNIDQNGSAVVSNGGIKLDAAEIITGNYQFKNGIIEYSVQLETGFENSLNIRARTEASYETPLWLAYSSIYKGAEHCVAASGIVKANDSAAKPVITGEKYNYRVDLNNGKIRYERLGNVPEAQATVDYQFDPAPKQGYLSLRSGGDGNGKNIMYFGPLRVRKSADSLPIISSSGSEEAVELPVFYGAKISTGGDLVLNDDETSGYYARNLISNGEPTRIMIPSWKFNPSDNAQLEVSISADKGANYKQACENEKYYYASKKDFTAGSSLKSRFDFSRSKAKIAVSGLAVFSLDYRPGKINVISPSGGETWAVGSQGEIVWLAGEYEPTYPFNISYSADKGNTYNIIVTQAPNSGEYVWQSVAAADNILIKVADAFDENIYDTSDKAFSSQKAEESNASVATGAANWNDASAWSNKKVPGATTEVTLASGATIYAKEPISFRSLTIGDGEGKSITKLVLQAGINKTSGEIIIRKGGRVIQDCKEPVVISGNLSLKSGSVLTHENRGQLDITAKNITLEPGSLVEADAKNNYEGGIIRLSTTGDFNIFGTISASGDDKKGSKGGAIYLTANKFGGSGAFIYAEGGSASKTGNGGKFVANGKGAISGLISINPGGSRHER